MKYKFLLAVISFFPGLALAQAGPPSGVNATRYEYCMTQGLGNGRSYATPQIYCSQWAGPSQGSRPRGMKVMVPCGFDPLNDQPLYATPAACEAALKANAAAEAAEHKRYLAYQNCMRTIDMGPGSEQTEMGVCQYQSGWPPY